jgi:F0F1-type ATP synthase membrane subunit b/b'
MLELNATFFVQLGIFLAVMIALRLLFFEPFGRLSERREAAIKDIADDIGRLEKENDEKAAEYQRKIDELKSEILDYKSGVKREVERERAAIVDRAKRTAEDLLKKEEDDLKVEAVVSREHLDDQAQQLAEIIYRKILSRPVKAK